MDKIIYNLVTDPQMSPDSWSDYYLDAALERIVSENVSAADMILIFSEVPNSRKKDFFELILATEDIEYLKFIEDAYDGSTDFAQLIVSHQEEFEFSSEIIEKSLEVLKKDTDSRISQLLVKNSLSRWFFGKMN